MKIKNWLNAQEIADFQLEILPNTKAGVIYRAKKDGWINRKRASKGGGLEYAFDGLPAAVQAEIKQKHYKSLMTVGVAERQEKRELNAVAVQNRDLDELDHSQREAADARLRMALLVAQYAVELGSRTKALNVVSQLSRESALPINAQGDYNEICATALAKKRKKAGVGVRKLHEWCIGSDNANTPEERLKVLAPQKQGQPTKVLASIDWLPDFMAVFRNTNGVCIARAYREFAVNYAAKHGAESVPHEHKVRRVLKKMPAYVLQAGRITGAELKALKTYVKRDWSKLKNNDVWVGDGHSLKMKVQHPEHGQPFTPELTVIMDAASRYVVGWSLSYSESQIAVADALRHGMVNNGIPAMYYSDNGGGQANKTFDADITGILPRLGVHHETGIPGNPQGRGIIERFMKEAPNVAAQQFATYYGNGADRETTRKTLVAVQSLAKAEAEHKTELTPKQKHAKGKLPTWAELVMVVEAAIEWYNHEHLHRSIGDVTPAMMRAVIGESMDENDIVPLSEAEAKDMYRPAFKRVVQRAWLKLFNKDYWHKALEPLDGQTVVMYVDQHDASSVIVRDLKGKYICEAKLDGNKRDAFPETLVEQSKRKRAERRLKKLSDEAAKAKAELNPAIEHEKTQTLHELMGGTTAPETQAEYVMFESDLDVNNGKQAS